MKGLVTALGAACFWFRNSFRDKIPCTLITRSYAKMKCGYFSGNIQAQNYKLDMLELKKHSNLRFIVLIIKCVSQFQLSAYATMPTPELLLVRTEKQLLNFGSNCSTQSAKTQSEKHTL